MVLSSPHDYWFWHHVRAYSVAWVMSDYFQLHDCSPPGSLPMGLPREEYWSRLPWPPPGHLPNPGIEPSSLALHVNSLPLNQWGSPLTSYFMSNCFVYPLPAYCGFWWFHYFCRLAFLLALHMIDFHLYHLYWQAFVFCNFHVSKLWPFFFA